MAQNAAMRAILITSKGGPEVMSSSDVPEPRPATATCSSRVEAVGVNYRDVYEREGRGAAYGQRAAAADRGRRGRGDGAARRRASSPRATASPGRRRPGSYAERVAVPLANAVPIPDGTSSEQAAAAILQGMTAHYLCHSTYPVQPGDVVRRARRRGRRRAAADADGQGARRRR